MFDLTHFMIIDFIPDSILIYLAEIVTCIYHPEMMNNPD